MLKKYVFLPLMVVLFLQSIANAQPQSLIVDEDSRSLVYKYMRAIRDQNSLDIDKIQEAIDAQYKCSGYESLTAKTYIESPPSSFKMNCVYSLLSHLHPLSRLVLDYAENHPSSITFIDVSLHEDGLSAGFCQYSKVVMVDYLSSLHAFLHEIMHAVIQDIFKNNAHPYPSLDTSDPFFVHYQNNRKLSPAQIKQSIEKARKRILDNVPVTDEDKDSRFALIHRTLRAFKLSYSEERYNGELPVWYVVNLLMFADDIGAVHSVMTPLAPYINYFTNLPHWHTKGAEPYMTAFKSMDEDGLVRLLRQDNFRKWSQEKHPDLLQLLYEQMNKKLSTDGAAHLLKKAGFRKDIQGRIHLFALLYKKLNSYHTELLLQDLDFRRWAQSYFPEVLTQSEL